MREGWMREGWTRDQSRLTFARAYELTISRMCDTLWSSRKR